MFLQARFGVQVCKQVILREMFFQARLQRRQQDSVLGAEQAAEREREGKQGEGAAVARAWNSNFWEFEASGRVHRARLRVSSTHVAVSNPL